MLIMQNRTDLAHGWVSAHCGRGTIDIIWSCLVTIFLCVWTAIHLPLPHYKGKWPHSTRDKIIRSKAIPAVVCVIAPELITFTAVIEYFTARTTTNTLRDLGFGDISIIHGFFLDMGGFCLQSGQQYCQITIKDVNQIIGASSTQSGPIAEDFKHETVSESNPSRGGDSAGFETGRDPVVASSTECMVIPHPEIGATNNKTAAYPEWLIRIAQTTEDRINDAASSDTLTKFIACVQALWFVTQVVSRLCEHRAVTLLEVSTSAYVFCAVIAYAAWWKKPQGCNLPILINCAEDQMPTGEYSIYSDVLAGLEQYLWGGAEWLSFELFPYNELLIIIIFPMLFGAIHMASWDVTLPSDPELWMWRASAVFCAIFGILVVLLGWFWYRNPNKGGDLALGPLLISLYFVVRLFMLVEIFISLRALPRGAYESVQWSSFIPHI